MRKLQKMKCRIVTMLSVIMLGAICGDCHCADSLYAECHYAEHCCVLCRYAKCCYAQYLCHFVEC